MPVERKLTKQQAQQPERNANLNNVNPNPIGDVAAKPKCDPNAAIPDPACEITGRDPEDREVHRKHEKSVREKMMDKTLADSYPASDPPSSIPDPGEDDSMAA